MRTRLQRFAPVDPSRIPRERHLTVIHLAALLGTGMNSCPGGFGLDCRCCRRVSCPRILACVSCGLGLGNGSALVGHCARSRRGFLSHCKVQESPGLGDMAACRHRPQSKEQRRMKQCRCGGFEGGLGCRSSERARKRSHAGQVTTTPPNFSACAGPLCLGGSPSFFSCTESRGHTSV